MHKAQLLLRPYYVIHPKLIFVGTANGSLEKLPLCKLNTFPKRQNIFLRNLAENVSMHVILCPIELISSFL